jgi:signal transduction histidine kinase
MVNHSVGKNHFSDFLLLDSNLKPLISDFQSESRLLPIWENRDIDTIIINDHMAVKKLSLGHQIIEYRFGNLAGNIALFLFEDQEIEKTCFRTTLYIFGYVTVLILFLGSLIFLFRLKLLGAINSVNKGVVSILQGEQYVGQSSVFSEYIDSKETLEKFSQQFRDVQSKLEDQVKINIMGNLTKQVAHDIRSPLSALNMVMATLRDLPEEKRLLMKNSVQRINDIANDLLSKSKISQQERAKFEIRNVPLSEDNSTNSSGHLLSILVDSIVSEKRIQYREKINVRVEADLSSAFGIFVNLNAPDLSRVISNLINNSIEAFDQNTGVVTVSVKSDQNFAIISVKDNGKGIPPNILPSLGAEGFSYGKDGPSSGSGLGIYHAKKTVAAWGGKLEIQSEVGKGTSIDILIPKSKTPDWFASKLVISPNSTVISVDDDLSIHQIWRGRFESLRASTFKVSNVNFTSAHEFRRYPLSENMYFLVDFEFLNQNDNGLSLIRDLNIADRCILVTSRYEEDHIRESCRSMKIKLMPKQLAGFVPIEIDHENLI